MFPLSSNTYIIGTLLILSAVCFTYGRYEHTQYMEYKNKVEAEGKAQEAHVESIKKQQELVTKGIQNEYDAKLALLRQYYANGVRQPNTSKLPNISNTTNGLDAITAYNLLAGQCAETSQQLISLQAWINEQIGIK
jgi:hypothetical protein